MEKVVKIIPTNGRVYAIHSSEGAYLVLNDFWDVAAAISQLYKSYFIKIELVESVEAAWRLLESVNISRQIKTNFNLKKDSSINSLPHVKGLPYGALGASLTNVKISNGAYYMVKTSICQYFCLQNLTQVANAVFKYGPVDKIEIQMVDNAVIASRYILAEDAKMQIMAGKKLKLLSLINDGENYGVQGCVGNYCENILK